MKSASAANIHRTLSGYTLETVRESIEGYKNACLGVPREGSWVHFLGTGGNPVNLIKQYRQTGGFLLKVGRACVYVDPGPGAIVHASRAGVDLSMLDAVYVSHGHTDHLGDAGVVIEAMCRIMSRRRGTVIAPREVLENGLISRFHQGKSPSRAYPGGPLDVIEAKKDSVTRLHNTFMRFIPAYHGGENYGFVLETENLSVGYTSDTSYLLTVRGSEGVRPVSPWDAMVDLDEIVDFRNSLKTAFSSVDVLIANVSYHSLFASRGLTGVGLAHMLRGSDVRLAIMTHLDAACFRPQDITGDMARYVQSESGVPIRVAQDNEVIAL